MRRFAFVLLALCSSVVAQGWTVYMNERFGYSLEMPPGLQVSNRAADGSGVTWQTGTVRMQVSGLNNPYKIKPHEYFANVRSAAADRIVKENNGYSQDEGYWMEILYTKESRRIHRKIFIAAGSINIVEFSYGYKFREEKESLGQRTLDSFRPGDLNRKH